MGLSAPGRLAIAQCRRVRTSTETARYAGLRETIEERRIQIEFSDPCRLPERQPMAAGAIPCPCGRRDTFGHWPDGGQMEGLIGRLTGAGVRVRAETPVPPVFGKEGGPVGYDPAGRMRPSPNMDLGDLIFKGRSSVARRLKRRVCVLIRLASGFWSPVVPAGPGPETGPEAPTASGPNGSGGGRHTCCAARAAPAKTQANRISGAVRVTVG